jgi:phosphate transport system substrate-binding protein
MHSIRYYVMAKQAKNTIISYGDASRFVVVIISFVWAIAAIGSGLEWLIRHSGQMAHPLLPQQHPDRSLSSNKSSQNSFAQVQNVPTGHFSYGGSPTWASIRLIVDPVIQAERREFQLRYIQPTHPPVGSGKGIRMLLDGELSIAQTTRPPSSAEYQEAEQRGFILNKIPVAIDGISVAVHPQLNISGLTLEQLRAIYSGDIINWRDLGGPDLAIRAYSPPQDAGDTASFFAGEVLKGKSFGPNVAFVDTSTEALRWLAAEPGGIYYASAPEIVTQCSVKTLPLGQHENEWVPPYQPPLIPQGDCPKMRNRINIEAFQTRAYPLIRHLYIVIKDENNLEEKAGDAYASFLLTRQGQKLLQESGFVPIH